MRNNRQDRNGFGCGMGRGIGRGRGAGDGSCRRAEGGQGIGQRGRMMMSQRGLQSSSSGKGVRQVEE